MVFRTQNYGLGAAKVDKRALRDAQNMARDDWKQYIRSLENLDRNLRRGASPPDQPLPSPPATPAEMAPDLVKQAKQILEGRLPAAYETARNLAVAKANKAAASAYAAGQPAVSPEGTLTNTDIPQGDLPGQTQQVITDAYGVTPVLTEAPASRFQEPSGDPYAGQVVDSGQVIMYQPTGSGGASAPPQVAGFPLKKILVVAGLGLAVWLAYRWWSKRKR